MADFPAHLADRFQRFKFRHFAPNIDHYERLAAEGQSPEVMIISCCDSRVDPEAIFSAMPGELFVMRNVANLVPPYETGGNFHGVSAALEFAVLNLKVKHLVIMGHSSCGGVKAALNQRAALETEARFISKWMSMLDDAKLSVLAANQGEMDRTVLQRKLEEAGIKQSIANLRTFPAIKQLEDRGELALHGTYFDIGTASLSVLDHATGTFIGL
ncbi:MAG: carbonic anhydrase [Hyphomicrobiaceae bacterium]|nr:carbonic anhydrase [Hyphomicrobiaceae bacterium]